MSYYSYRYWLRSDDCYYSSSHDDEDDDDDDEIQLLQPHIAVAGVVEVVDIDWLCAVAVAVGDGDTCERLDEGGVVVVDVDDGFGEECGDVVVGGGVEVVVEDVTKRDDDDDG